MMNPINGGNSAYQFSPVNRIPPPNQKFTFNQNFGIPNNFPGGNLGQGLGIGSIGQPNNNSGNFNNPNQQFGQFNQFGQIGGNNDQKNMFPGNNLLKNIMPPFMQMNMFPPNSGKSMNLNNR